MFTREQQRRRALRRCRAPQRALLARVRNRYIVYERAMMLRYARVYDPEWRRVDMLTPGAQSRRQRYAAAASFKNASDMACR